MLGDKDAGGQHPPASTFCATLATTLLHPFPGVVRHGGKPGAFDLQRERARAE